MNKWVLFLGLIFIVAIVHAQDTRNVADPTPPKPQYQTSKKKKKGLFTSKKKKKGDSEVADFRARLKEVYKEKAKEERMADKKRYKEHGYFGHKRKPKKRPPGKMKFCKVCGLKH